MPVMDCAALEEVHVHCHHRNSVPGSHPQRVAGVDVAPEVSEVLLDRMGADGLEIELP